MGQSSKSEALRFDLAASPGHLLHRAQQFASERFSEATGGVELTHSASSPCCARA